MPSRRTKLAVAFGTLVLFASATAQAGGIRNKEGHLLLPISGQISQFDRQKIEIRYLKRILVFKRSFGGLPQNLEPRPDRTITVQFTLAEWAKLEDKLNEAPPSKRPKVDLRETFP